MNDAMENEGTKRPPPLTDQELFWKTIDNAKRLEADSKLLSDNDRVQSAIILGIFAIEELGKALITFWGVKNLESKREYPTHVEKQTAVFILLSANELLKKNKKRLLAKMERGDFNFLTAGIYSNQFAWARAGFYDDVRMAVTYADRDPKIPRELTDGLGASFARELHGFFLKASRIIGNPQPMGLASEIYKNGLGRM